MGNGGDHGAVYGGTMKVFGIGIDVIEWSEWRKQLRLSATAFLLDLYRE